MITLVVGLSVVVPVLMLIGGLRLVRRRRVARAVARQDSALRRAARIPLEARVIEDPVMHWVPDDRYGGWRLAGRFLPDAGRTVPTSAPRRRRRDR